ncbi:NAD(P)-binding protein [Aureobasidium pullulans]|uniref:NAD(P)-binding protein n=1 Tax=Aureobasidium pullulans TaxID=5580 RepID=A0AB38LNK0_AURPU|nr:NAD(P)-binding protein [Aureobasidium pullulans]
MAETHHFHAHKLFSMDGKVAVVTGGGSGIGLMATQALAANAYLTQFKDVDKLKTASKEHEPEHGEIIPIGDVDVTNKDDLEKLVQEIQKKEKCIHLLVANAGVPGPKAEPDKSDAGELKDKLWKGESVQEWNDTYSTDVTSVYFTTVAFLPLLQAAIEPQGSGERFSSSVITTSSMSGIMRHAQGHFAYNTAKGATVHLTKLMSAEFMKVGVRVNSIAPGYFPSEMTAKSSDDRQKSDLPPEKVAEKGHVPQMRGGRDEEMGMAMLFLAKNTYVNGEILAVDGGVLNMLAGR